MITADKEFLENAFKSLDDIETEEQSNKILKENFNQKDLKEDLDLDDLSDKYVHQTCVIIDPNSDYRDEHGEITKLIDYENDLENSVWEITLDDGTIINVEGNELKLDLEEKLPKDLAKAYEFTSNNIRRKHQDKRSKIFPTAMTRRKFTTDFENSNYTEISKEEALKNYKDKGERCKLRVLYGPRYAGGNHGLMMWDADNDPITSPTEVQKYLTNFEGSSWSFKDLINNASKIYVTDEDRHPLNSNSSNLTNLNDDDKDLLDKVGRVKSEVNIWRPSNEDHLANVAANELEKVGQTINPDTGHHLARPDNYYLDNIIRSNKIYQKYLKFYKENPQITDEEKTKLENNIETALNNLKNYQRKYLNQLAKDVRSNKELSLNSKMNKNLAEIIVLKWLLNNEKKKFNEIDKGNVDNSSLYYHEYNILTRQLAKLNERLQDITNQINETKAKITSDIEDDYKEKLNQNLGDLADAYYDLLDELNKFRKEKGLPTENSLKEAVDNIDKTHDDYLRIYTVNSTGFEDFVDDHWETEEEALNIAKELVKSGEYDKVCLVCVRYDKDTDQDNCEILYDSDNPEGLDESLTEEENKPSIGQIVDDIIAKEEGKKLKEDKSLTESKKFNIKDDNQIVDAVAYKTIGDEEDDKLVVVDPSLESTDDKYIPHEGDAILQCNSCKTVFFKSPEELEKDPESDNYNIDMPCPHCGAKNGFTYEFQAASKDSEETKDIEKESEDVENMDIEDSKPIDNKDNKSLKPIEDEFISLDDIDNIKEESFERLVNPYLTKLYENVKSFKTTDITQVKRNQLKIEGKLIGNKGKEKLVEFLFTIKDNNAGSIVFEGYNKLLTEDLKAYTLKGKVINDELIFESLEYRYNKNVNGENILIEGIEK